MPAYVQHREIESTVIVCPNCLGLPMYVILAYDRQVAVVRHYPHLILSLFYFAFVAGAKNVMAAPTENTHQFLNLALCDGPAGRKANNRPHTLRPNVRSESVKSGLNGTAKGCLLYPP